jgi:hypothetical protein
MDTSPPNSSVTLKLEEIQRRCQELRDEPEELLELSLEDADAELDPSDPYNHKIP